MDGHELAVAVQTRLLSILLFTLLGGTAFAMMLALDHGRAVWATSVKYIESAHAGASGAYHIASGVNRISMADPDPGYPEGHCAHCHEQHASVGGVEPAPDNNGPAVYLCYRTPFGSQTTGFCFSCHKGQNSRQVTGNIINYDYSQRRGEDSKTCPTDIKDQFRFSVDTVCESSVGSSHDLENIRDNALLGEWEFGTNRDVINPCLGCHNPHRATVGNPCSPPSYRLNEQDDKRFEIWGDDPLEQMANSIGSRTYQPLLTNGIGQYERDDQTFPQPNYNILCLECHNKQLGSTEHGTIMAIDWGIYAKHGAGWADYDPGDEKGHLRNPSSVPPGPYPYEEPPNENFDLCCTDCHEPHGSRNKGLIRTKVNMVDGIEANASGYWFQLCNACHEINPLAHPTSGDCSGIYCHGHGAVEHGEF